MATGEPVPITAPPNYSFFAKVSIGFGGDNVGNCKFKFTCERCWCIVGSDRTDRHTAWHDWLLHALPGHPVEPTYPPGT